MKPVHVLFSEICIIKYVSSIILHFALPVMTIFGDTSVTLANLTYTHTKTVWDDAANYTYGSLLVILIPIGVIFNSLVYKFYHTRSETPSSVIYRCLAVSDLLVCTCRGLQQANTLFSANQQPFFDNKTPSVLTRIIAFVTMTSGVCMMTEITLLSLLRLLALVQPIWAFVNSTRIKCFVTAYILVTFGVSTGISVQYLFRDKVYYSSVTQWIVPCKGEKLQFIIDVIIPVVCMSLTSLSSIFTVGYLIKTGTSSRRSSITILLMSAGVILWNIMLFVAFTPQVLPIDRDDMLIFLKKEQYEMYYVYYLVTCFFPVVRSFMHNIRLTPANI